jgi:hypothetical protein
MKLVDYSPWTRLMALTHTAPLVLSSRGERNQIIDLIGPAKSIPWPLKLTPSYTNHLLTLRQASAYPPLGHYNYQVS